MSQLSAKECEAMLLGKVLCDRCEGLFKKNEVYKSADRKICFACYMALSNDAIDDYYREKYGQRIK